MYKSYQHVERASAPACEGLLNNPRVFVEAKVDGTNACVWYEHREYHAGSRKREVSLEDDNAGFAQWFFNSEDEEACGLRTCLLDHPDFYIYGEWMAKFVGQIKDYNQEAKYHFYIFDVYDAAKGEYLASDVWRPILAQYDLEPWFVEILAVLDYPTKEQIAEIAQNNKFLLDNADHPGEGVVLKCYEWRNQFGRQQWGKLVLDEYKREKARNKAVRLPGAVEQEIVEIYVSSAELAKTKMKVVTLCNVECFDSSNAKMVGMMINFVWRDLLEENILAICKRFKNPTIDFASLKGLCNIKTRKYLGL